ncbi:MAG TPA: acyl-CoA dehydrogenase, partial [Dehalococcoidia bacterium]|nr:acyl-CoA dehydrogenase [Dehalococcoidia bacterium]
MEFRFTPEEEAFRQEIRAFLDRELPADWATRPSSSAYGEGEGEQWRFLRDFQKKLAEKGWLTQGWPRE